MIRIASIIGTLLVTVSLSGCKLIDELRTFDLNYSVDFTIPSSSIINLPINIPTPPTTTNSEQRFEDEGVESDWIDSIKLMGLTITITAPQGTDFDFLEDIALFMNADGQQEMLIAQKNPVPEGVGSTLQLEVSGTDLYPYISQNSFSLRTQVTTDEALTQDIDCRADLVIEVKATIPGT